MKKPRLAIECIVKNEYSEWEQGYTTYFDIEDKDGILNFIQQKRNNSKIERFYYANEYGIEINWE